MQTLREYFRSWRGFCDECVGGFLALLGGSPKLPEIEVLAQEYLGQRPLGQIRDQLGWQGSNIHQAVGSTNFSVEIVPANVLQEVINLLGEPLSVPMSGSFTNLLVGNLFANRLGGRVFLLRMRQVDASLYGPKQLSDFLRHTSREVLKKVFVQEPASFDDFWDGLENSDAMEIEVTQALLLDHIITSEKQLHLHGSPAIRSLFLRRDQARRQAIEAGRIPDLERRRQTREDAAAQEQTVREELSQLLRDEPQVSATFLKAVRTTVNRDYQYQPASVPFEIFQNADDAYVELVAIAGGPASNPAWRRFVVLSENDALSFAHWGRLINRGGSDHALSRSFPKDLEKMLLVGGSDKNVEDSAPDVTGKFGIGFKSVFLISDSPQVLSGRLAFRVVGGVLPERVAGADLEGLRGILGDAGDVTSGTLIHLTLSTDLNVKSASTIDRFRRLAPLLLVFAHRIDRLEFREGGQETVLEWAPQEIPGAPSVKVGRLGSVEESGLPRTTLRMEAGPGTIALGLSARGVTSLGKDVPGIWVTSPTEEVPGLGFAINGPFEPDVGRVRLASSQANKRLAIDMAAGLGQTLVTVFDVAESEFSTFREALDLASDTSPYQFWFSLLDVLASAFPRRDDEDSALALARTVIWTDRTGGLQRLLRTRQALPTGLWSSYQRLVQLTGVRHIIKGFLDEEELFSVISSLDSFGQHVNEQECVSEHVARKLPPGTLSALQTLDLEAALQWEVGSSLVVSPALAATLGSVISKAKLDALGHSDEDEHDRLTDFFSTLRFSSQAGPARVSRELLLGSRTADEPDEASRALFAPSTRQLSSSYNSDALAFFKLCRPRLDAPSDVLAEWGRQAQTDAARIAFLQYLDTGLLSTAVRREIVQGGKPDWMSADQAAKLQPLNLVLDVAHVPDPLSAREMLEKIEAWWQAEGSHRIWKYASIVYPDGRFLINDSSSYTLGSPTDRQRWMELFILAATHTLGRVDEWQNREFVLRCRQWGWIDIFARPRSDFNPADWFEAIHTFIDEQAEPRAFVYWLSLFVPIFQLSTWLDEYVQLFSGADSYLQRIPLDELLAPNTSTLFQGGGPSAPPLTRTLGVGANFVLRELARAGVLKDEASFVHCFVPSSRVVRFMEGLSCGGLTQEPRWAQSKIMANFLREHLPTNWTFDGAFDLPLQILAGNIDLQLQLFGAVLAGPDPVGGT